MMFPNDIKQYDSKVIYKWQKNILKQDDIEVPNGDRVKYSYLEHPGSVIIIPLFPENEVIVTEQFRYPIKRISIEFPAGGIEKNEKAEDAAQRELVEEIGLKANKLIQLGIFYASNSISNEKAFIFLATELIHTKVKLQHEDLFKITLKKISIDQLRNEIYEGKISDGFTISATFFLLRYLHID